MASYYERKDSPFFWIRFRKPDSTWAARSSGVRVGSPGALREIAQMVAKETAKESMHDDSGSSAMFRHWVPLWIDYNYSNAKSRGRCLNAWAHISVFLASKKISHPAEVTYALGHEYVRWRTNETLTATEGRRLGAWNTAVMETRFFGAMMQEALRRGWVNANPFAKLGLAKREAKEKPVITVEEEEAIFKAFETYRGNSWMKEAFLVAMKQGCRLREVKVPLDRIDLKRMIIQFRIKGQRFHPAPLHKDLLPLVYQAIKEKRKHLVELPPQPSPKIAKFLKKIGLSHLCFHCTRVTVVTRLCEAGFSESQTMAYVGHASATVHAIYRKTRPVAVAKLGDVL